tara:strand:+ start:563 stop:721 length:159 start_codon:yes stop_codon:yes gene_type:complete
MPLVLIIDELGIGTVIVITYLETVGLKLEVSRLLTNVPAYKAKSGYNNPNYT